MIDKTPFEEIKISRGQSRGLASGVFSRNKKDDNDESSDIREVGKFKGLVAVRRQDQEFGYSTSAISKIMAIQTFIQDIARMKDVEVDIDFNNLYKQEEGKKFTELTSI